MNDSIKCFNYALELEIILKRMCRDVEQQGVLRRYPRKNIENVLTKYSLECNDENQKKLIDEILKDIQCFGNDTIDDIVKDGFDFDGFLESLRSIKI